MTKTINITANGNVNGVDSYLPMDVWHGILRDRLADLYPGATINIEGDANTYGDSSAWLEDANEGTAEDIGDVVQAIFERDVPEGLWVAHGD